MSENFVFSSFKKPNRVTKNAAVELPSTQQSLNTVEKTVLCVEERGSRQTGED